MLQRGVHCCKALSRVAAHCAVLQRCAALQHIVLRRNICATSNHVALRRNLLQRAAPCLQCSGVGCNALQLVATERAALQRGALQEDIADALAKAKANRKRVIVHTHAHTHA
jgi:hypothetical protein